MTMLVRDLVCPVGGLVSRVRPVPGSAPYRIYVAELGDLSAALPQVPDGFGPLDGSGGGTDDGHAATVAVAEALERYSACVYDDRALRWATARELGAEALDLATLPRCSATELAHPACPVTDPDPAARIRWVAGLDLHTGTMTWIPAVLVYLHLPAPVPGERFTLPISTGCAAHPDLAVALTNAACEVIERDALTLTWLQRLALPRLTGTDLDPAGSEPDLDPAAGSTPDLDPAAGSEPELDSAAGPEPGLDGGAGMRLFDATTDLGIPTVYGVDVAPAHPTVRTVVACATDLDPGRATAKVRREGAAGRLALEHAPPAPAELDRFGAVSDGAAYMGRPERADAFDFLLHTPRGRAVSELAAPDPADSGAGLRFVLDRLAGAGYRAYAVDLTTDEAARVGMHVVRVVIPGLQPLSFSFRARFLGHPRLYEAPARMGFPAASESDLTPWPQPFA
jgi:ribosomal protein S12 methylthiotransferase accessory factor